MSCSVDHRCDLDPLLLWLRHRPATTAPIRPLAWEPPCAMGTALEKTKKKKKEFHDLNVAVIWIWSKRGSKRSFHFQGVKVKLMWTGVWGSHGGSSPGGVSSLLPQAAPQKVLGVPLGGMCDPEQGSDQGALEASKALLHLQCLSSFPPPRPFFILGLHLWHMGVSRRGVKSELQLVAYATATATQDLSQICDLHHSSWQCQILNPLS